MTKHINSLGIAFILSLLLITACEESSMQSSEIKMEQAVTTRTVEYCYECPNDDDCCCGVWLQNTLQYARLDLCNTTDGTATCPAGGGGGGVEWCPAFNAVGGQSIYLHSGNIRDAFCVAQGTTFSITNTGPVNAYIKVTCQHDLTAPQILTLTIAPYSTWEFVTNNACELSDCYY